MREERFLGKITIRGKSCDAAFVSAAESALGAALPLTPNTVAKAGGAKILWLSPEEWLLWTADEKRGEALKRLEEAFAGIQSTAVDVSDYYTIIKTSGARAEEALSHGCPLDFRPSAFAPGTCAQTRFRNASILLYKADDAQGFDVQVRWSFAEYLWDYFVKVGEAE